MLPWKFRLADYNEAIRLKPEFADAYFDRGVERSKQKQWEKAMADYNEAIRLKPEFADAYLYRGVGRSKQKQWKRRWLINSHSLKPEFADAYLYRGLEWSKQKQWKRSIKDFNIAIQLAPADWLGKTISHGC